MAGRAALGAGEFEAAERWFRSALSKDENDPHTWYSLGRSLVGLDRDDEAYESFSAALDATPDDALTRRIHGRMGQIAACRLDLKTATDHFRSAQKEDRAQEIDSLASQFAGALAQLKKLRATVDEIRQMERQLDELGDIQGVTAMQERAAAEQTKINEIEDNLEAVRSALCR
jgi:Flp pilus assembly protein TadD